MALDPWGQHILNFWDVWQRDDALKCSLGVSSGNWLACWRGGLSLLETGHVWNLNGSYEFLRWVRIRRSMSQGRSFLGSRDLWFSDRMAFPRVCADLLFGKCGLAKSRSTHGLDVGIRPCAPSCSVCTRLAGCGARAGSCADGFFPVCKLDTLWPTHLDWDVWQGDDALGVPNGKLASPKVCYCPT